MESILLNNGVRMPLIGYGCYLVPPAECARCVADAIRVGYRHIDTAHVYYNEEGVGKAVAESGIPRGEFFLTTKIWPTQAGEVRAAAAIDLSLKHLRTDYIDLVLIHQQYGDYYGTWRAMEAAVAAGKVRAIGLSNFPGDRFVDLAENNAVKPAIHQVKCNVFVQQREAEAVAARYGCRLTAWGPLDQGAAALFDNPVLQSVAAAHGRTVAQVALRWLVGRGIVVIPKSTHIERMRENLDIFDFALTPGETAALDALAVDGDPFARYRTPEKTLQYLNIGKDL